MSVGAVSMLSTEIEGCGGDDGVPRAETRAGISRGSCGLCDTPDVPLHAGPIPVHSSGKLGCNEPNGLLSPAVRCDENKSASSTSLDADDEAEAGPTAETSGMTFTPSSALVFLTGPRWLVESNDGDALLQQLGTVQGEEPHAVSTPGTHVALPQSLSAEQKTSGGPSLTLSATSPHSSVMRCRRSAKRAVRSNSPCIRREVSSSDVTPSSSPMVSHSTHVSLSQPQSAFSLSSARTDAAQPGCATAEDPIASAVLPAVRCVSSEVGAGVTLSCSPLASPPLAMMAATVPGFSDGPPEPRDSDAFLSPRSSNPRLAFRAHAGLQQFGCCVFFFPAPLISWLFPLLGHVAISNAEGSRLFTFESSYYVREEKLAAVLDRVLREESSNNRCALTAPTELNRFGQRNDASDRVNTPSPIQSPLPHRGLAMSDASASASDAGLSSPSDIRTGSPLLRSATTPQFPLRSTARPPRRTGRSRSAGGASATGHMHTRCVRIWDLKPLLMESRGRRARRAPCSITGEGGKQAAVSLWERLQGLLQSTEGPTRTGPRADGTTLSQRASHTGGCAKAELSDDVEGTGSATSRSSSSTDEDDEYELLDAETAHFYNRNLNATIRLFRGSADGSNNSPDVVLQHHSSFSFVGFVLEACRVGSQVKRSASTPVPLAAAGGDGKPNTDGQVREGGSGANGIATEPNEATSASTSVVSAAERADSDEAIHWGSIKLLFHICVFGKWHRGEGRLRRALHGGSITSAGILWVLILILFFHYFSFMFSW
ncbi:hypothetical protein ABL78_0768 [Leptomonas seymouri]|uniref:Transmembrane protein n=1 Tax=Leptomonas seymouri TaxID=5684 RepID=A0A0N1I1M3_LEPSE|nr:hypothetical protein ABL78_0768 [Leptomonas seymouri]|eukprot:KPI90123.1 hypothetical protein ABL78_0768 [Leptomonas seymouri]